MKARSSYVVTMLPLIALGAACAMPADPPPGTSEIPSPPPSFTRENDRTEALIFNGASAWPAEVNSLASALYSHGITYVETSSSELDSMSLDELSNFSVLIFPGGDAATMTESLSKETHARLREAVQKRGTDYLGFCAGAWAAVAPAPAPGHDVAYGFGIVDGPIQSQTSLYKEGREFALTNASFPDGTHRELLWYGGPITPDRPGGVIAKYADGTPAITQIRSGKGFVIVSGLHPFATQAVFEALGLVNPDGTAFDLAWEMLDAVLHQKPMPAFPG